MTTKRHNSTETVRIQISLDANSALLLGRIATYGSRGKNKAEVATRIVQDWLIDNGSNLIAKQEAIYILANDNTTNSSAQ